jgi:hypothetical protein
MEDIFAPKLVDISDQHSAPIIQLTDFDSDNDEKFDQRTCRIVLDSEKSSSDDVTNYECSF